MNSCSCLTLIVACIIYWQAKETSRVIRQADPEGDGIELALLRHVSPSSRTPSLSTASTGSLGDASAQRAAALSRDARGPTTWRSAM